MPGNSGEVILNKNGSLDFCVGKHNKTQKCHGLTQIATDIIIIILHLKLDYYLSQFKRFF